MRIPGSIGMEVAALPDGMNAFIAGEVNIILY